jgi:exodeoxyribonuclease VII large subunit
MPVYEVSQVTSYIKELLERDFLLQDVWVAGEVSNFSRSGAGHSYFTLRDANASIRCVMFRNGVGAERLDSGAAVIAHGRFSVYEVRGEMQMIVDIVQPEGVGELQLKLEQLRLKLENEGLFDQSRKRDIPEFPKRIGVITSPTGAVWHDIQTVISRRYPLVELAFAPAPVQGDTAAPGIVEAFQSMNAEPDIDVVIVGRGGGSLEDLWPFNEESVARAIYASKAPVISAVGHETDYTIADLVADKRAATPSAAAEMAVPDRIELASNIIAGVQSMQFSIDDVLSRNRDSVNYLKGRLDRGRPDLDTLRIRIDDLLKSASVSLRHNHEVKTGRYEALKSRLESLSPKDTLRRGYAIVQRRDDSSVIDDASQVKRGDRFRVMVSKGEFDAEVTST